MVNIASKKVGTRKENLSKKKEKVESLNGQIKTRTSRDKERKWDECSGTSLSPLHSTQPLLLLLLYVTVISDFRVAAKMMRL